MKKHTLSAAILLAVGNLLVSCGVSHHFDAQAHRGGRGLMPENTIASEKMAIDYNCTMELDLQMSKDKQVVVSHDSYLNSLFCLTPEGDTMTRKDGLSRLIYNMPYDSVKQYDAGIKPYPAFPRQQKIHTYKPLLSVLIDSVEAYGKAKHHVNHYNMEIKSSPGKDGETYPSLTEFVDSCMAVIDRKEIASRTMIQSFDERALRMVHEKYPDVETSYLVGGKEKRTPEGYVDFLGFKPDIFSPEFHLVTPELVKGFHKMKVRVIPWTPDTVEDMQKLKDMDVDGMITDYPDYYAQLK